jgi:5'-deoxynucleotidase YfbR-like HD superfamily hydrolase
MSLYKGPGIIRTISGKYIDLKDPQPEDIEITDIAHGLCRQHRWGGHTLYPLSVAEHSIQASKQARPPHKLAALLHDASEAYMGDLPGPIKALLPEYQAMEDRLQAAIAKKYGVAWPWHDEVKRVDKQLLEWEWEYYVLRGSLTATASSMKAEFMKIFRALNN